MQTLLAGRCVESPTDPLIVAVREQALELGFDWALFVRLRGIGAMSAFPAGCQTHSIADLATAPCQGDPLWKHAKGTILPFLWDEVEEVRRESIALASLREGCAPLPLDGGGVPIHGPLGAIACLYVGSHRDKNQFRLLFRALAPQLQWIGQQAQQLLVEHEVDACHDDTINITPRQAEVLPWLILGKTNWEIGKILGIAEDTARQHVIAIMRALGASNRTEAAAIAARRGFTA